MNWVVKNLTNERKSDFIKIAGLIGEKIVANLLNESGKVAFSIDPYAKFDLEANGSNIQVKTATPYLNQNAWVIEEKGNGLNVNRIFEADELYIVGMPFYNAPTQYKMHVTDKKIVRVNTKNLSRDENIKFINGKKCFFLDRDSVVIEIIRSLTREEEVTLYKYATSYFS